MTKNNLTPEKLLKEIEHIEVWTQWAKELTEEGSLERAYLALQTIKNTNFMYLADVEGGKNE